MGCQCIHQHCLLSPDGSGCNQCKSTHGSTTQIQDVNGPPGTLICACEICTCTCSFQCHADQIAAVVTQTALEQRASVAGKSAEEGGDGLFGHHVGDLLGKGMQAALAPNVIGSTPMGRGLKQPRLSKDHSSVHVSYPSPRSPYPPNTPPSIT